MSNYDGENVAENVIPFQKKYSSPLNKMRKQNKKGEHKNKEGACNTHKNLNENKEAKIKKANSKLKKVTKMRKSTKDFYHADCRS